MPPYMKMLYRLYFSGRDFGAYAIQFSRMSDEPIVVVNHPSFDNGSTVSIQDFIYTLARNGYPWLEY